MTRSRTAECGAASCSFARLPWLAPVMRKPFTCLGYGFKMRANYYPVSLLVLAILGGDADDGAKIIAFLRTIFRINTRHVQNSSETQSFKS
eukprot:scaffold643504_cov18-Prasinocladus_malaysianus.AAC.1